MGKDVGGRRAGFMKRFVGAGLRHRGGFEGPETVPPLTASQIPLVMVDGVLVKPELVPADSPVQPSEAGSAPDARKGGQDAGPGPEQQAAGQSR